jgi:hypothetical protein
MERGAAALIRRAQNRCPALRQVHIVSYEAWTHDSGIEVETLAILAPPSLVAIWKAPASGEWPLERIAGGYLLGFAEHVLSDELIPF